MRPASRQGAPTDAAVSAVLDALEGETDDPAAHAMVGLLGRAAPTHTERTVKLASELLGTGDLAKQMHGMLLARALGGRAAGLLMSIEKIYTGRSPIALS